MKTASAIFAMAAAWMMSSCTLYAPIRMPVRQLNDTNWTDSGQTLAAFRSLAAAFPPALQLEAVTVEIPDCYGTDAEPKALNRSALPNAPVIAEQIRESLLGSHSTCRITNKQEEFKLLVYAKVACPGEAGECSGLCTKRRISWKVQLRLSDGSTVWEAESSSSGEDTSFVGETRFQAAYQKSVEATREEIRARVFSFLEKELPERLSQAPAEANPPQKSDVPKGKGNVIAVFDIEDASKRFPQETLDQLTEYLSAQLSSVGCRVIPREQIRERLLKEKAGTYKACYDQSCQIELGRELAAEKTISTKLLKIGKRCAVTAVLFDLATATTERSAPVDSACDEEALMDAMKEIAKKMAP